MITNIKPFSELSLIELYEIIRLRAEVFVLEQQCLYQDLDYQDLQAIHFRLMENNQLIGYARILVSVAKQQVTFGRVITRSSHRGQGVGKKLVHDVLHYLKRHYPDWPIEIQAQQYLEKFYQSHGFVPQGEPYDMDGISHIKMSYQRE